MRSSRDRLRQIVRKAADRGASAVEYGLMVAAIAAVIAGVVFGLGNLVHSAFGKTCSAIQVEAPIDGGDCNGGTGDNTAGDTGATGTTDNGGLPAGQ